MFNRREDWEAVNRDKLKASNPFVNNDNSNEVNLIHLKKLINDDNHRFTFFISVPMNGRDDEEINEDISDAEKYYSGLMDKIGMKYEFKNNFNSTYDENDLTKLYGSKYSRKEDLDRVVSIARLGEAITKMATCDAVIFINVWEKSKGCYIEHKVADKYNLNIFHFYTNPTSSTMSATIITTNTKEIDNVKTEYSSIFGGAPADKVGTIGTINDGTYNVHWVIYSISGNTYQLFPMQNLDSHRMNPTDTNAGGYEASEMYTYIHNTVLPNLKRSGLNITSCDLVSRNAYNRIVSRTYMTSATIAGGEVFWLTDPNFSDGFYLIDSDGSINGYGADISYGVRPLITVVK